MEEEGLHPLLEDEIGRVQDLYGSNAIDSRFGHSRVRICLRTRPDVARWVGKSQPVGSTPFVQCRISLEESTPAVNSWRKLQCCEWFMGNNHKRLFINVDRHSRVVEAQQSGQGTAEWSRHSRVVEMNTFEGEFPSTTNGHSLNSRCL